ncbi:MAG: cytochrome b N-terminal domain-containing protein [Armatimonadetes bacterium]|nr:cytochrome b N-terminal domain-containing protein [Armatimonadota bacterium]
MKVLKKPVPKFINLTHCFGGITFLLFGVQVISGILLAIYYKATPDKAYESVQYIVNEVPMGWLIRQVHAWGANLMIIAVMLHTFRILWHRAYRPPREFNWVVGSFLLFATMAFGFSGYLLPWDQLSYWATTVGTEMASSVPVIGPHLLTFMRGGATVDAPTLTRFYALHVLVLPVTTMALLGLHFLMVRRLGVAKPL